MIEYIATAVIAGSAGFLIAGGLAARRLDIAREERDAAEQAHRDLNDRYLAALLREKSLSLALEKAQRNDMPRDPATGRWMKRAA